jgi:hypothetical protein
MFMEKQMKIARFALAAILVLSVVPHRLSAQDSEKSDAKKHSDTLKVKITFSENEGDKKLSNLPYTFYLKAGDPNSASWTKVRMGSRVPVYAGKDGMQYIDVGTNIDARAVAADGGGFDIYVKLERSWVEGEVNINTDQTSPGPSKSSAATFKQPIIRQFKTDLTLTLHDDETIETAQASDPLSGKVLTISVTMNVTK